MIKFATINGLRCRYEISGKGYPLILLHGWGQSIDFWKPLDIFLSRNFKVYKFDLPGFGMSQEPTQTWNISKYSSFLKDFVNNFKIQNPIIIGHSFGGRISAYFASENKCKKLILYSSSGVSDFSFRKKIFLLLNIIFKEITPNSLYTLHCKIYKPNSYINHTIHNAKRSKKMIDIYINLNGHPDMRTELSQINTRTLLIYGDKDNIVNKKIGREIYKIIPKSHLAIIHGATHFAHLEKPKVFNETLINWIKN